MFYQKSIQINGRFQNPWLSFTETRLADFLKFVTTKNNINIPHKDQLDQVLPIVKPDFHPPTNGIKLTWLGHSTLYVQFDGMALLTDPIFSQRASPFQWIGPKRYRFVPCTIDAFPLALDAVIISHNHYDHLDLNSICALYARFGSALTWFVPLGLAAWFYKIGIDRVIELDWWQSAVLLHKSDVRFVCTPAQHWSKRILHDTNKSLWGSWSVIGPKHRFFFCGDTGYCTVFKQIGDLYGPFTVAAIPIGAYEPRWFMQYHHVNPEEAVQIHQDVQSLFSVAIHWGTFSLSHEYYLDPLMKLREVLYNKKISSFVTFKHGESRLIQTGKS